MKLCAPVLIGATLLAACSSQKPAEQKPAANSTSPAAALTVAPLTLPAPADASEPQFTTSARGTIVSWVEQHDADATLKFAERTGTTWSEPRTVVSGKDWFLSDADVPSVLRLADGTLAAAWYRATNIQDEAYDTWLAWSKDDGKTWSTPFKPYKDRTRTQHGFATLFDQPGGGLGLVWLDARNWELDKDAPDGGSVMLRSASFDPSWKQTADQVANLRVCDCCQTSVATTTDGVVTAFRDRSDKEIRDIHVTRLENGKWTNPQAVHDDNWEIDSCPVNGPAISARGNTVAVAWFTAAGGQGHAFAAFSSDAGRTWGQPVRLDEQVSTGRVDIELLDDGSAVASWIEFANQRAALKARKVTASGVASAPVSIQPEGAGSVAGYPHMARQGDDLLFLWTESAGGEHAEHEGHGSVQMKGAIARVR